MDKAESKSRTTYHAPRLSPFGELSAVTLNGTGTTPEYLTINMRGSKFCANGVFDGMTNHYPCI